MSLVTPIKTRSPVARSKVSNGTALFTGGGDERNVWARRFRDLIELHVNDLGGADQCSEAQLSIVRRAAALEVSLEGMEAKASADPETFNIDVYGRASGNLRRLLESLGLKRVARTVSSPILDHFSRPPARTA